MGRSQDSFNKKEREKKRQKKKKEKAERKEAKKAEGVKSEEFLYMDADGNLSSTPPDPTVKREEVDISTIEISIPKQEKSGVPDFLRSGRVKFFNTEKGFGFIDDNESRDSVFVHIDGLVDQIRENDLVSFELGKGPRGPIAKNVKLIKK